MSDSSNGNRFISLVPFRAADLTLECVILLVPGMFMLIFGLLQEGIRAGDIPYNPDSSYGLLLVMLSLQMLTLGKTPIGTVRRSWLVIVIGITLSVPGTIACFIPGLLGGGIRELVGMIMTVGGIALFLQLTGSHSRAVRWIRISRPLRHLAIASGLVYVAETLFGIASCVPGILPDPGIALISIFFGISLLYLAGSLQIVSHRYPGKKGVPVGNQYFLLRDAILPTRVAIMLLSGVIFLLFSFLLVPVGHGMIPFSRDSQVGLLMVIMAIQVLALGKTPVGEYHRSWPLMSIGLAIASLGIYCCIVPVNVSEWTVLPLGAWNICTGCIGLRRLAGSHLRDTRTSGVKAGSARSGSRRIVSIVFVLYLLTIIFGINLILPGLIPGVVILFTLFMLGVLLLVLAYLLLIPTVPADAD